MLLFLPARLMPGQAAEPPAPIFPADGKPPAEVNAAELLQAVCPGKVELGEKFACECPAQSGLRIDGFSWSLMRVTRGHFLSPASDDAVLSMEGCEPHSENFGGTILLTQDFRGWNMLWYKAGVEASQCHKVQQRDGREILVCIGDSGGQGNVGTDLYVEDLLHPTAALMAEGEAPFFSAVDNTGTCGDNPESETKPFPVTRAFIERVEFLSNTPNTGSAIAVTASFGVRPTTRELAEACLRVSDGPTAFAPPAKSYRLDFVFDGHDYKPTAASAETARMFASR